mgnify:CR=1 FL=1
MNEQPHTTKTPIDGYLAVIRSYFCDEHYRIKEFNEAYDSCFHYSEPGWIYCTNFITKFNADVFMFFKRKSPYIYFTHTGHGSGRTIQSHSRIYYKAVQL